MSRSRGACLAPFVLLAIAVTPVRVHATAPPRVVAFAELAARPVEVAISSKQVTLIHFETGEVSMVAVGDPALVRVTVKGPDVLLTALTASGSTNAFIWQAGRYTQWIFLVRQNSKDARLIIVKDAVATSRDASTSESTGRTENEGKNAIAPPPGTVTSLQPVIGATAASPPTASASAQPSTALAPQQPTDTKPVTSDACGKPVTLDQFLKTLNARQRELFGTFLTEPTLARLQMLLRELIPPQRCDLLGLLAGPVSPARPPADSPGSLGTASRPPATDAQNNSQAMPRAADRRQEPQRQGAPSAAAAESPRPMPAKVAFTVTPEMIDGHLFLYYILENQGEDTLLTDILRLRIFDRDGNRLAFRINRASQDGYIGRLETNGVEYGVIGIDTAETDVVLEWRLITMGSGAHRLLQREVQGPAEIAPDFEVP